MTTSVRTVLPWYHGSEASVWPGKQRSPTHLLRHILTVPPFQLEPLQNAPQHWKQTNTSIYKTITYSCHLHAKLWAHGAMSALNFLKVYPKKITMVTGDTNEKSHLYQRISIALQRGNAASLCSMLFLYPRRSSRMTTDYRQIFSVPTQYLRPAVHRGQKKVIIIICCCFCFCFVFICLRYFVPWRSTN